MERQITQAQVATGATETLRADIYKIMPGRVVSYDAGQETATIQPGTNDVRRDLDTGARISEPWGPIPGVPIWWLRFGGFIIKGSLNPYDPVVLAAFDLDPTAWRAAGRTLKPVDPADIDRHGSGYWFAIPGDLSLNRSPSSPSGSLTIGVEGGQPLVTITSSGIQLGAGATAPVALATLIDDFINLFVNPTVPFTPSGTETAFAQLVTALSAFKTAHWSGGTVGATLVTGK